MQNHLLLDTMRGNFQPKRATLSLTAQICPKMDLSPDAESAPPRYYVHHFSGKIDNCDFFGPNLPKNGFWGWNFEKISLDAELIKKLLQVTMCANFQAKRTILTSSAQICPKMDFGVGISKL